MINTPLKEVPGFLVDDPLFYQWVDENQQAVSGETKVQSNLTLTASYAQVVTTYDEFMEALGEQQSVICLGADIAMDTSLTVDYSCSITSQNGSGLIRTDGLTTESLLTVQGTKENPILVSLDGIVLDGKEISSEAAAVHVTSYATLEVTNTLIQNNINTKWGYQAISGGGISNAGTLKMYDGTILRNNQAESGGGVYCAIPEKDEASNEYNTVEFYMYGGEITENTALSDSSSCLSAGGGVAMDSKYRVFSSFYMYGGKIYNNSAPAGNGGGVTLGCGDHGFDSKDTNLACEDCNDAGHVPFLFYGGEITDNDAQEEGGGVWLGCSAMDMRGGLIARNTAGTNGGGISNCCYCSLSLRMTGGTITKNRALFGGGIGADSGSKIYGSISGTAMIYDNVATDIGDDLYEVTLNESQPDKVLTIQNRLAPRPYQKSLPTPNQVLAGMAAGIGL